MEEALEFLMSTRGPGGGGGIDSWNSPHGGRGQHPDDQNPFDRSNINQQRFNSQQLPFAVPSVSVFLSFYFGEIIADINYYYYNTYLLIDWK